MLNFKKLILAAAVALTLGTSSFAATTTNTTTTTASTFSPQQTQAIQQIIRNYLINNPQVLVEAINALQQQQQTAMVQKAQKAIIANAKQIFADQASPIAGNPNGTVTLVEFFDYQCPHCKDMTPIVNDLTKKYPQLKVIYKEFPIFPNSEMIARAALASEQQGKYTQFHNALMQANVPISADDVYSIAKSVGLNVDKLKSDMNNENIQTEISNNLALAQTLGLAGTPAFIVASQLDLNKPENSKISFVPGEVPENVLNQMIANAVK